ncbi:Por secretion system C-terminal sorting domain-containing protein [Catalinimonas alkaloidigena]|uniref:Por secretion system C-terminal sorting domain-containing protein n=1 Tax=Catalinimonas alkaloidigena TaxID=1075417 RepID=A0A1G8WVF3_9BACT|nr:T9SS type A sorting domain-containing protein [Catalinimonas alkaloidigena]SDJ82181.1 Por secretion system C-terminal sorting domain-containing protein [Catalinimonas alkaloidigena]
MQQHNALFFTIPGITRHSGWVLLLWSLAVLRAQAQEHLEPIAAPPAAFPQTLSITAGDSTPIGLPFFEDFTRHHYKTSTAPDTGYWEPGSGVTVNNALAVNPPSFNAATFDGLDANQQPYVSADKPPQQLTDSLVSRRIALGGLAGTGQANSVYLSFAWQAAGPPVVQAPSGQEDSLVVQFRRPDGAWVTFWMKNAQIRRPFRQEIIQVPNDYLHDQFQFRFLNYGRPNGNYDVWHVDYIYLNANRYAGDTLYINREEFAISTGPTRLLRDYTAIPYEQFQAFTSRQTADSVYITANLLGTQRPLAYNVSIRNADDDVELRNLRVENLVTPPSYKQQIRLGVPIDDALVRQVTQEPTTLEYRFMLDASGVTDPARLNNDTAAVRATFGDYYAYDDGSAELAYFLDYGQFALAFYAPKRDTLTHVQFYFAQTKTSGSGRSFQLKVWDSLNADTARYTQNVTVQYNGAAFTEYKLDTPLVVQDTFYVGYFQTGSSSTAPVRVGFDVNNKTPDAAYINLGSRWTTSSVDTSGNFMIRPVLRSSAPVTSTRPDPAAAALRIYPNPSSEWVRVSPENVLGITPERLLLRDMLGRVVLVQPVHHPDDYRMDVRRLPAGVYVVQCELKGGGVIARKLIITR